MQEGLVHVGETFEGAVSSWRKLLHKLVAGEQGITTHIGLLVLHEHLSFPVPLCPTQLPPPLPPPAAPGAAATMTMRSSPQPRRGQINRCVPVPCGGFAAQDQVIPVRSPACD